MDSEDGLNSALAELPARIEALRSGDEAAVLDALRALTALAPLVLDAEGWRWVQFAATACTAQRLLEVLVPLLADERYTDAALALCVPVLATLLRDLFGVEDGEFDISVFEVLGVEARPDYTVLADPLITLLVRAAADEGGGGDALQRAERLVHSVLDCLYAVHSLTEEQALSEHPSYEELEAALVALMRRPPCSAADVNAYRAACMLCSFQGWAELQPDGLGARTIAAMSAAVAAIPSASIWRGSKGTSLDNMTLSCGMLEDALMHSDPPLSQESEQRGAFITVVRTLLMAQPGALAAVLQRLREVVFDGCGLNLVAAVSGTTQGHDSQVSASELFCQSALLDAELSLSEVLSPEFTRVRDEWNVLMRSIGPQQFAGIQQRFVAACTSLTAIQLLRHPPDGAAFAAAAAAALLASHSADVAALLPLGARLETLTRAYAHACAAPPWAAPGMRWHEAERLRRRHARLRFALSSAAAFAGMHAPAADAGARRQARARRRRADGGARERETPRQRRAARRGAAPLRERDADGGRLARAGGAAVLGAARRRRRRRHPGARAC